MGGVTGQVSINNNYIVIFNYKSISVFIIFISDPSNPEVKFILIAREDA